MKTDARGLRPVVVMAVWALAALGCSAEPLEPVDAGNPDSGTTQGWPTQPGPNWGLLPVAAPSGPSLMKMDPNARFEFPPLQQTVETWELNVPQAAIAQFAATPRETPLAAAEFVHDGKRQPVMVRLRGNSSRVWMKKSWKVEFPEGVEFEGRDELNLVSQWYDATLMVEKLGYDLLAAMGVPAPRVRFVRLVVNGRYQGIYTELEQVDKHFLKAHQFPDDDATIYRCGGKDCEFKTWLAPFQDPWEKRTNELDPSTAELDAFLRALNQTPEPQLVQVLGQQLELELFLRNMVMNALLSNYTVEDSRSYFIHDALTQRWHYVPWDLNNASIRFTPGSNVGTRTTPERALFIYSLADPWVAKRLVERRAQYPETNWHPLFSNLHQRILLNPELREMLLQRLERGLNDLFAPGVFDARIDAMHALIAPYVGGEDNIFPLNTEGWEDARASFPEKFADGPRYLKKYAHERAEYLRQEIQQWRSKPSGLVLDAIDPREGWVELRNRGRVPVSTTGMVLTTNLRQTSVRNVPAQTLAPGEAMRLTAAQLGLTLQADGELGLFNGTSMVGLLDALFYGELPAGKHYARSEDSQRWEIR